MTYLSERYDPESGLYCYVTVKYAPGEGSNEYIVALAMSDPSGVYSVSKEVAVNENTGACRDIEYTFEDVPEVFRDVLKNKKTVRLSYGEEVYLKECYFPAHIAVSEGLEYAVIDLDGDVDL